MVVSHQDEPRTVDRPSQQKVAALLPPTPPGPDLQVRGYLIGFTAAMGFLLLTLAGRSHLTHIWAEDGALFVLNAETRSLWTNLTAPYGGYLHTVPRLIAELMSVLPLTWAPVGFTVFAALVRTTIAMVVFAASGGHLRSIPVRIALASLVVVLPAGNSETLGNIANLHWFLAYGAFWALLWRPASRGLNVLAAVLVLLAAVSSPLVFLLAPLALARLWLPTWRERWVAIAFGAGSLVQVLVIVFAPRVEYSKIAVDPVQVALASLLRVPVVAFAGSEQVAGIYQRFHNWPVLAAVLLAAVPIVAAVVQQRGRLLAVLGVGYSALMIVIVLTANWHVGLQIQQPGVVMNTQRYSITACLFLFTAIAVGLDVLPRLRWSRVTVLTSRVVIGVVVLVSIALHIKIGGGLLDGIPWDRSVADAGRECAEGKPEPKIWHEPDKWFVVLPCEHLPT